jgi:hypothetical protein
LFEVIRLKTPGGMSMWLAITSARITADSGVSGAGLRTTTLPAARAGAVLPTFMPVGAFQGVIAPPTPRGSWRTRRLLRMPGISATGRSTSQPNVSIRSAVHSTSSITESIPSR